MNDRSAETGYEICASCGGSGLALNMAGEPDECTDCKGNTVVRTSKDVLALADELCKLAVSYAGDTGLYREASLWAAIEAYQNARASSETSGECPHCRAAYEVWAGSDGFVPETAAEGYQKRIVDQMREAVERGLAAKTDAHRVGPDTPNNDMVICPQCTSQFVAIPVNVQERLATLPSHARWLRQVADEIRKEGHAGWGNTCEQAADALDRAADPRTSAPYKKCEHYPDGTYPCPLCNVFSDR